MIANAIAVLHGSGENIGDRLNATVGCQGRSAPRIEGVSAFRFIAVFTFCITPLGLRTLSGVFKLVSAVFGTGGRPSRTASASENRSFSRRKRVSRNRQLRGCDLVKNENGPAFRRDFET
jgi:hypothetical protein